MKTAKISSINRAYLGDIAETIIGQGAGKRQNEDPPVTYGLAQIFIVILKDEPIGASPQRSYQLPEKRGANLVAGMAAVFYRSWSPRFSHHKMRDSSKPAKAQHCGRAERIFFRETRILLPSARLHS
jgi:hypothetical protein